MKPKLHVVTCSTRPGRVGPIVATWFAQVASEHAAFEVEGVDLADFDLPIYDEPKHPRLRDYAHEHTKRWSATVETADAYVFVLPEYNYGPPPSFVNAVNYLYHEWTYKPAGMVGYGGISGALRAVQQAKLLLTTVKIMPTPEAVPVPMVGDHIKDGVFHANAQHIGGANIMLDELARWAGALKTLRS